MPVDAGTSVSEEKLNHLSSSLLYSPNSVLKGPLICWASYSSEPSKASSTALVFSKDRTVEVVAELVMLLTEQVLPGLFVVSSWLWAFGLLGGWE